MPPGGSRSACRSLGQFELVADRRDGGIVADLNLLQDVTVDADARTARATKRDTTTPPAAGGGAGVAQLLDIIEAELRVAMQLTGVTSIDRVDRAILAL